MLTPCPYAPITFLEDPHQGSTTNTPVQHQTQQAHMAQMKQQAQMEEIEELQRNTTPIPPQQQKQQEILNPVQIEEVAEPQPRRRLNRVPAEELQRNTHFNRQEIQGWYTGFLKVGIIFSGEEKKKVSLYCLGNVGARDIPCSAPQHCSKCRPILPAILPHCELKHLLKQQAQAPVPASPRAKRQGPRNPGCVIYIRTFELNL